MEPTKAQKNLPIINDLKEVREDIRKLSERIAAKHNSAEAEAMVDLLQEADHKAIDRMVSLGLTLKLEDSSER